MEQLSFESLYGTGWTVDGFRTAMVQYAAEKGVYRPLYFKAQAANSKKLQAYLLANDDSSDESSDEDDLDDDEDNQDSETLPLRTLFLANIPLLCTEDDIRRVFSPCGAVQSVVFSSSLQATKTALVPDKKKPKAQIVLPNFDRNTNVGAVYSTLDEKEESAKRAKKLLRMASKGTSMDDGEISDDEEGSEDESEQVPESSIAPIRSAIGGTKNIFEKNVALDPSLSPAEHHRYAHVIFRKMVSIKRALNLSADHIPEPSNSSKPSPTGLELWISQYTQMNLNSKEILSEVDNFMNNFDNLQEQIKEQNEKHGQLADEGGWVLVKSNKEKKTQKAGKVSYNSFAGKIGNKTKHRIASDFYPFQTRQSRTANLEDMREKFAEDKKKIESMKDKRHFKPF